MGRVLLLCVVSSVLCCLANGFCEWHPPTFVPGGEISEHCTYRGTDIQNGQSVWLEAPACLKCDCSNGFVSCCGYGWKAGAMNIAGCTRQIIAGTCNYTMVDANDPNQPCWLWNSRK